MALRHLWWLAHPGPDWAESRERYDIGTRVRPTGGADTDAQAGMPAGPFERSMGLGDAWGGRRCLARPAGGGRRPGRRWASRPRTRASTGRPCRARPRGSRGRRPRAPRAGRRASRARPGRARRWRRGASSVAPPRACGRCARRAPGSRRAARRSGRSSRAARCRGGARRARASRARRGAPRACGRPPRAARRRPRAARARRQRPPPRRRRAPSTSRRARPASPPGRPCRHLPSGGPACRYRTARGTRPNQARGVLATISVEEPGFCVGGSLSSHAGQCMNRSCRKCRCKRGEEPAAKGNGHAI